jgi:hypothetical protein
MAKLGEQNAVAANADRNNHFVCGDTIILNRFSKLPIVQRTRLIIILRNINHVKHVILPAFRDNRDLFNRNLHNRIKFFRNQLDEAKFRSLVHKSEKSFNKCSDICEILEAFTEAGINIMMGEFALIEPNIDKLLDLSVDGLRQVSTKYSCVTPDLDRTFGRNVETVATV